MRLDYPAEPVGTFEVAASAAVEQCAIVAVAAISC